MNDWRRDYHYELPEDLIARRPPEQRGASRMLVVDRNSDTIAHRSIADLPDYMKPGDLAVFNNTRVIPARYFDDDGKIEVVLVEKIEPLLWKCLVRPGKKMRPGRSAMLGGARARVEEVFEDGSRLLRLEREPDPSAGRLALPHYLGRQSDATDLDRYQTIYASTPGAIAAPTAGLHFTSALMKKLSHVFLTLHVGPGTFQPVRTDAIEEHRMHEERFELSVEAAAAINEARRVLAVGTTTVRVLESLAGPDGRLAAARGRTSIFIYPPYRFKRVDRLLTNFHLPETTLLLLVCAFGGRELILRAYREAVREKYRFYSYGDCMLIL